MLFLGRRQVGSAGFAELQIAGRLVNNMRERKNTEEDAGHACADAYGEGKSDGAALALVNFPHRGLD